MTQDKSNHTARLKVVFGGYSDKGLKASNEDAFGTLMPEEVGAIEFKGATACVADGVSGSSNAQLASQTACTNFISDYYSTPEYWTARQSACRVLEAINSWFHLQDRNSHQSGGMETGDGHLTTFSAVVIKSHTAHIFHVGDSRIYRLEQDSLEQLTDDHSYLQGTLRPHLIRGLGIEKTVDIQYRAVPIQQGDRFLLTSDGVHDSLSDRQLETLLRDSGDDIANTAKKIAQTALNRGSQDNVTALIVAVEALPEAQIHETYRKVTSQTIPGPLQAGSNLDHFTVIRTLASGSRSHVYLVRSQLDRNQYVIKIPSRNYVDDIEYLQGFVREQWVGTRLDNPRLMKIYEQPADSKYLYHVCEYIEGITLRQWLTDRPCLNLTEARTLLREMIKPVRYLHRNNMIHRDLKPENFIINQDGTMKLIDFGTVQADSLVELSTIQPKQTPVGDIGYIAPEYLVRGHGTNRSDLFSLACIVYEMMTKELPYAAILSNQDHPRQYNRWDYRPISLSPHPLQQPPLWVDRVLHKALAPNPKFRYAQLSEFETDLLSPSAEILNSVKFVPLIERNPLLFWKGLSLCLVLALIAQTVYFLGGVF